MGKLTQTYCTECDTLWENEEVGISGEDYLDGEDISDISNYYCVRCLCGVLTLSEAYAYFQTKSLKILKKIKTP